MGEHLSILYELSWLWKTLGIALTAVVLAVACAMLISKAMGRTLNKKVAAIIGTAAFVVAILVIMIVAQTPMLI